MVQYRFGWVYEALVNLHNPCLHGRKTLRERARGVAMYMSEGGVCVFVLRVFYYLIRVRKCVSMQGVS